MKRYIDKDVLTAARERVAIAFDGFEKVVVAFSGGKDSTVLLDLVATEARRRGRTFALFFVDLEAQYKLTIDFIAASYERYADVIEPYWLAVPIGLRNAVSVHEPKWVAWDPAKRDRWVRAPHSMSITDTMHFPWYRLGMEFEDLVEFFAFWYADGTPTCTFVAIRSDESLNRFRVIVRREVARWSGHSWTAVHGPVSINAYPIYDWRTEDIWRYHAKTAVPYNPLYDRMHAAGLSIHQMRICQPYGDDQRKGLWLYHVIEPETWPRVVARVGGANSGALYARERGSINGMHGVSLPDGHTWQSYARLLLDSLPRPTAEHYRTKISVFIKWYQDRGYDEIPDVLDRQVEAKRGGPSWRRICKTILRNDWWCKGLGFAQHRSGAYAKYMERMKEKRAQWAIL